MCEPSASLSVTGADDFGPFEPACVVELSSDSEPFSTAPVARITERSMKFCNSRNVARPGMTRKSHDEVL